MTDGAEPRPVIEPGEVQSFNMGQDVSRSVRVDGQETVWGRSFKNTTTIYVEGRPDFQTHVDVDTAQAEIMDAELLVQRIITNLNGR